MEKHSEPKKDLIATVEGKLQLIQKEGLAATIEGKFREISFTASGQKVITEKGVWVWTEMAAKIDNSSITLNDVVLSVFGNDIQPGDEIIVAIYKKEKK